LTLRLTTRIDNVFTVYLQATCNRELRHAVLQDRLLWQPTMQPYHAAHQGSPPTQSPADRQLDSNWTGTD